MRNTRLRSRRARARRASRRSAANRIRGLVAFLSFARTSVYVGMNARHGAVREQSAQRVRDREGDEERVGALHGKAGSEHAIAGGAEHARDERSGSDASLRSARARAVPGLLRLFRHDAVLPRPPHEHPTIRRRRYVPRRDETGFRPRARRSALHRQGFLGKERLDRYLQPRIAHPMHAVDFGRQEPALELVMALRARLEARQASRDRALDQLVVAALEVQERRVVGAAPVASVEARSRS